MKKYRVMLLEEHEVDHPGGLEPLLLFTSDGEPIDPSGLQGGGIVAPGGGASPRSTISLGNVSGNRALDVSGQQEWNVYGTLIGDTVFTITGTQAGLDAWIALKQDATGGHGATINGVDVSSSIDKSPNSLTLFNVISTDGQTVMAFRAGGGGGLSIGAKVRLAVAPALMATNAFVPIAWDTATFNHGGVWKPADPTKLFAPVDGVYLLVTRYASGATSGSGRTMNVEQNVSGAQSQIDETPLSNGGVAGGGATVSQQLELGANDFVQCGVRANTGQTISVPANSAIAGSPRASLVLQYAL